MKQHNIIIRQETPADYAAVEHLTREAFWNVYRPLSGALCGPCAAQ